MSNELIQAGLLQATQKKGKRANTKRVIAALTKWARKDIELSRKAGRDVYHIAKEHEATSSLVLQIDLDSLRTTVRDLQELLMGPPPAALQVVRKPEKTAREMINQLRGKIA